MFRKLFLQNYKSFKEIEVDFTKSDKPLNLIFLYGENGSGKSNIISAFLFLKKTITTLNYQNMINNIVHGEEIKEDNDVDLFLKFFNKNSLHSLTEYSRMIDSQGDMILKFEFQVSDKRAIYELYFDEKNALVREVLNYQLNKTMVKVFDFSRNDQYINPKIINDNEYRKSIKKKTEQYWGKHTFLSICQNEFISKDEYYIENVYNENFYNLLKFLNKFSVSAYNGIDSVEDDSGIGNNVLSDIESGFIPVEYEEDLNNVELALKTFLIQVYSDIKNVKYKRVVEDTKIQYELYIYKLIGEKIKEIPIEEESTGTQRLIKAFTYFYLCSIGEVVLLDELDSGIHDVLMLNIIRSLSNISGQLIITTHNTMLLEEINPNSAYIIRIDSEGNKLVQSISKISGTQKNHNNRDRYINGLFDGVPYDSEFDFTEIAEELKEFIKN